MLANPYLEQFLEYMEPDGVWGWDYKFRVKYRPNLTNEERAVYWDEYDKAYWMRQRLVRQYAWAVPTEEAVAAIAELSPLVEIGCGTGYWASLIAQLGGKVQAFDNRKHLLPHNQILGYGYHPMAVGNEYRAMRMYPKHTLFLCWPPYDAPMASNALRLTQADRLVYIGEGGGGCTADYLFHTALGEDGWLGDDEEKPPPLPVQWELAHDIAIPNWRNLHDRVHIYERIKA